MDIAVFLCKRVRKSSERQLRRRRQQRQQRVVFNDLHGACSKLFSDADIPSWDARLRRDEAIHILGSQFYLVGMEATTAFREKNGNRTTLTSGNVDDIKARASAAFVESLKKGRKNFDDEM
mgnify:CR=1 FL=1